MGTRRKSAAASSRARAKSKAPPKRTAKSARAPKGSPVATPNGWKCGVCGRWHDELPMGFGAPEPELASRVPENERDERVVNDGETCGVDEHRFLKGSLEIPVKGLDRPFVWTVWVALSEEDFERTIDLWQEPARAKEPPYSGSLATRIPIYPETLDLTTRVHTRVVGKRPLLELEPASHPLAKEQRAGITLSRVREIAEALLHSS